MKFKLIVVVGILFLVSQVNAQENQVLKNQKDKISYIIGMDIGNNLKKQSISVNPKILARGIEDAFAGAKPLLTEQEVQETMMAFQKEVMAKQAEVAKKNKTEGDAGTTHTSERSYAALTASFVFRSAVSRARRSVEIGFRYPRTTTSCPLVIPPSIPPARFEERSKRFRDES